MSFASVCARWSGRRQPETVLMRSRANLVATAVVAGIAALSMPAVAYVRTVTEAGAPTAWATPRVTVEFSLGAPPPVSDVAGFLDAAQQE